MLPRKPNCTTLHHDRSIRPVRPNEGPGPEPDQDQECERRNLNRIRDVIPCATSYNFLMQQSRRPPTSSVPCRIVDHVENTTLPTRTITPYARRLVQRVTNSNEQSVQLHPPTLCSPLPPAAPCYSRAPAAPRPATLTPCPCPVTCFLTPRGGHARTRRTRTRKAIL